MITQQISSASGDSDYARMREHMVESQLRPSEVDDPRLLRVIAQVPREAFVPRALVGAAYMDRSIPLNDRRAMSPTLTLGRLLIAADLRPGDRVLLVGAATGYAAAVIAPLVASVVAVEEDTALAAVARATLSLHKTVTVIDAPLAEGAPAHGPYDVIVIDGAIDMLPPAIARQLDPRGRIVAALVDQGVSRLARGVRSGDDVVFNAFADMEAAPLAAFAKAREFAF